MTPKTLSLHHLIRPSLNNTKKPPVLFMLHGYGSDEQDLFSFAEQLPADLLIISIRAPYPLAPFGYSWYAINFDATQGKWSDNAQAVNSRDKAIAFIKEAADVYKFDDSGISLLGFSQGAVLSYALGLTYPKKIKNIIALSGYINQDIIDYSADSNALKKLNIYASHGSSDQVIPPEWARKTPQILSKLGITPLYEEFPVGHGVSLPNFTSFNKWLGHHLQNQEH